MKENEIFKYNTRSANLNTLDDLYNRYCNGYYQSLDDLSNAFVSLINRSKHERCKNGLAIEYLNQLKEIGTAEIQKKKQEFLTKWRIFFKTRFKEN